MTTRTQVGRRISYENADMQQGSISLAYRHRHELMNLPQTGSTDMMEFEFFLKLYDMECADY